MAADRYTKYVNDDGIFEAPALVHSIDDVPDEFQAMYKQHHDEPDKYVLTAEGRELRDWMVAEVERVKTEAAAAKAALDAELATVRKENHDAAVTGAIRNALVQAGVKQGLLKGAAALVHTANKFEVEPSDDGDGKTVLVQSPFGLVSVDDAVGAFLSSDDGIPFRNAKQVRPAEGTFSAMIAGLKST